MLFLVQRRWKRVASGDYSHVFERCVGSSLQFCTTSAFVPRGHRLLRFGCVALIASPLCLGKRVSITWGRNEGPLLDFAPVVASSKLFMTVRRAFACLRVRT